MATGSLDANGIWQYGEDDSEPTFSGLLNKLAASTSTKVSSLKASDTTSGTFAVARIPNLQNLNGTLDIASGGTNATSIAGAQDSLYMGYVNQTPGSISNYLGTASSNAQGLISFNSVQVLSINDIFDTNHDYYKVIIEINGCTANTTCFFNLRLNGTDNSTASSYALTSTLATMSSPPVISGYGGVAGTQIALFSLNPSGSATYRSFCVLEVINPNKAEPTKFAIQGYKNDTTNQGSFAGAGWHNVSTGYDGFTISVASGIFAGNIQVIGMNR